MAISLGDPRKASCGPGCGLIIICELATLGLLVMQDPTSGRFSSRDFSGHRSGSLTMLRPTGDRDKYGYSIWEVQCDCGTKFVKSCQAFTRRQPLQSCGCGKKGRRQNQTHQQALFKKHKLNAKYRGLSFEISAEEHAALTGSPCAYCGAEPSERPHPFLRARIVSNGIDRIDSSYGYISGNCAPCCSTCNIAKAQMSEVEFRDWISRVYWHLNR